MDLELLEAAKKFVKAFDESAENPSIEATGRTYELRKKLKSLLNALTDHEKTFYIQLQSTNALICHYDDENGFTRFSQVRYFPDDDFPLNSDSCVFHVKLAPVISEITDPEAIQAALESIDYRSIYSPEFTTVENLRSEILNVVFDEVPD